MGDIDNDYQTGQTNDTWNWTATQEIYINDSGDREENILRQMNYKGSSGVIGIPNEVMLAWSKLIKKRKTNRSMERE